MTCVSGRRETKPKPNKLIHQIKILFLTLKMQLREVAELEANWTDDLHHELKSTGIVRKSV